MNTIEINKILKKLQTELENYKLEIPISTCVESISLDISKAYIYPLQAGGKRIRPYLTFLTAGGFGGQKALDSALKAALAIEKVHTYSLVHDDLPCMDNDDLRRGKPTTHKVFGEAKGLLVGDALLTEAFYLLCQITETKQKINLSAELVKTLAQAAGAQGMIYGQWLDISLTGQSKVTWEQMEIVHRFKTGKLIGACLELGFLCGISQIDDNLSEDFIFMIQNKMQEIGISIGLAFQIIDDLLDVTKSSSELGKTAGKDEIQQKATAPKLLGIEKAEELASFYTNHAIQELKNIFSYELLNCHKYECSVFRKSLIEFVEELLSRSH